MGNHKPINSHRCRRYCGERPANLIHDQPANGLGHQAGEVIVGDKLRVSVLAPAMRAWAREPSARQF